MPLNIEKTSPGSNGSRTSKRTIDYLRISVTDRCNYRCTYCMPQDGIKGHHHSDILSYEEILRFTEAAVLAGITRVRVTGGEPLARRDLPQFISKLAVVPGLKDLALTTNGSLLKKYGRELKDSGLKRINISLDSLNPERFSRITRGANLEDVLSGLETVLKLGFAPVKVNAVMLPGIESELSDFVDMARRMPVHVRFIEFMPIGSGSLEKNEFVPKNLILQKLRNFGELRPAEAPDGGGPARYFKLAGTTGTIGFISSMSDHFCSSCNRLRLTAEGSLRNCLFSDREVNIRSYISGDIENLKRQIVDSMNSKIFDRTKELPAMRLMSQIGG